MGNGSSQSITSFERICHEILSRLGGDPSERAVALTAEARDLLATLGTLEQGVPVQQDRTAFISRVLDLNRAVLEHTTTARTEPPPAPPTAPAGGH